MGSGVVIEHRPRFLACHVGRESFVLRFSAASRGKMFRNKTPDAFFIGYFSCVCVFFSSHFFLMPVASPFGMYLMYQPGSSRMTSTQGGTYIFVFVQLPPAVLALDVLCARGSASPVPLCFRAGTFFRALRCPCVKKRCRIHHTVAPGDGRQVHAGCCSQRLSRSDTIVPLFTPLRRTRPDPAQTNSGRCLNRHNFVTPSTN